MEKFELRKRKKRIYQVSLISLLALLGLIIWITNYIHMGFSIGDQKFRYVGEWMGDGKDYVFRDNDYNLVIIDVKELGDGYFSIADKYKVAYLDKTIYSYSYNLFERGWQLKLSDGTIYEKDLINVTRRGWEEKSNIFDVRLIHGIERVIKFRAVAKESVVAFILGIMMISLGLIGIIYSKEVWGFQHMFSVSGGEPTEFAISMNRLVGLVMILFGLLMYPLSIG